MRVRISPSRGRGERLGQDQTVQSAPAPTASPAQASAPSSAILVVEDDPALRRALASFLTRDGYQVAVAVNGQEALTACAQQAYTWILCDLHMPELDGPGLYHALQCCQPVLCARVIFLTGDTLTPAVQTFLAHTGVPWLTKPFTATQLRTLLAAGAREQGARGAETVACPPGVGVPGR